MRAISSLGGWYDGVGALCVEPNYKKFSYADRCGEEVIQSEEYRLNKTRSSMHIVSRFYHGRGRNPVPHIGVVKYYLLATDDSGMRVRMAVCDWYQAVDLGRGMLKVQGGLNDQTKTADSPYPISLEQIDCKLVVCDTSKTVVGTLNERRQRGGRGRGRAGGLQHNGGDGTVYFLKYQNVSKVY